MEKRPEDIRLHVKLVDAARAQLRLLREVERHPNLYTNHDLLQIAIYRYEVLWLPLKAAFTHKDLVPPLDVYWVWHCHMLSPLRYRDDTYRVTGTVVDHRYMKNDKLYKEGVDNARVLWKSTYPSDRFEINVDADWSTHHVPEYKSKIGYDLISAVQRQRVFSYQVALSHYKDRRFLVTAVERYKKYLCLKRKHLGTFLVPCYDFDLIWHAHQAHPITYAEDTVAVIERILNHDDSVTDRNPDSKLVCSHARTRSLWRTAYNENFEVSGGMFRGNPPHEAMYEETPEQIKRYCSCSITTEIRSAAILDYQPDNACTFLTIRTVGKTAKKEENTRIFHKRAHQLNWPEKRKRHYGKFQFDTNSQKAIVFSLVKHNVFCCCISRRSVTCSSEVSFKDATGYDAADTPKFKFSRVIEMRLEDAKPSSIRVRFSGMVVDEHRRTCTLRIEPESTTVEEFTSGDWAPVHLPDTDKDTPIKTLLGISRLINHDNRMCYRVRVMHSTDVMMSAVYVYQGHGVLQAVAHSVGNDQIPTSARLTEPTRHLCMNPARGERGMMVKDARGDWAFCVGRWVVTERSSHQADEGFLHLKIYIMATRKISVLRIPRTTDDHDQERYAFDIFNTFADLHAGKIDISPEAPQLAPRVALSYAVSILYLLCRPDALDISVASTETSSQTTAMSTNQEKVQLLSYNSRQTLAPSGGLERRRKCSTQGGIPGVEVTTPDSPGPCCSDMVFMLALGYAFDRTLLPSNDFILHCLANNQRLPNVWYDEEGGFGGHDENYDDPGGSMARGSFGGCSGDATDYGDGEADTEEDEAEEMTDSWADGYNRGHGGCGSCGGCGGCVA